MRVTPPARKSQVESIGSASRVVIPGRIRPVAVFLLVWLSFWTYGGAVALSNPTEIDLFLAVWLVAWFCAEVFVLSVLLHMIGGKEILVMNSKQLSVRLEIFGMGFSREYDRRAITNLRVPPNAPPGDLRGRIAFDYGAKTVRIARGIDEAEATMILAELRCAEEVPPEEPRSNSLPPH